METEDADADQLNASPDWQGSVEGLQLQIFETVVSNTTRLWHRIELPDILKNSSVTPKRLVIMNGIPSPVGVWQEVKAEDGRIYFYNTATRATQWTKPDAFMTPQDVSLGNLAFDPTALLTLFLQRAIANQPWKKATAPDGREYWWHTETKKTSWDMPQEYKDALELNVPPPRPAAP